MFSSFNPRACGLALPAWETIEIAARTGFGGVDLLVRDLVEAGDDPGKLRNLIADSGLKAGAFPLPVSWRGGEDEFHHDLARLPRLAEAAATIGLVRTATWVMPELPAQFDGIGLEDSRQRTFDFHLDRLGAIASVLRNYGIRLGLEVIGVESSRSGLREPFLARLADVGTLLSTLEGSAPNVGLLVDSFHLYAAGEGVEAGLRWGVEKVVWVHVADLPAGATGERARIIDSQRGLSGENGAVENRKLLNALADLGYDGPVTAEPLSGCRSLAGLSAEMTARNVAGAMRSVWPGT